MAPFRFKEEETPAPLDLRIRPTSAQNHMELDRPLLRAGH